MFDLPESLWWDVFLGVLEVPGLGDECGEELGRGGGTPYLSAGMQKLSSA